MLDIDHVFDDGRMDVARNNGNNFRIYQDIASGARLGRYRVLCCNCNQSKRRNHGLCQHFTERWAPWFMSEDAAVPDWPTA